MPPKKIEIIDVADLKKVWRIIQTNWYYILLCPIVFWAVSFIYTYKLTDIYAAKSQVLLKSTDTYDYQSQLYKGLGYYEVYRDITNQIRVLTSRDLIEDALSRVDFNVSYYIVGRVKTSEAYESLPIKVEVKRVRQEFYEKYIDLKILNAKEYELTFENNEGKVKRTHRFGEFVRTPEYLLKITKPKSISTQSIEQLKLAEYQFVIHSDSYLLRKYKSSLSVKNVDYTSILELTVEDEIPERAKTFLDTLSKVYIEYTLQSEIDINENTLNYINRQLSEVTEILNQIEGDLERYKKQNSILNLTKEENQYFSELVKFDAERRNLLLELKNIDALEKYINSSSDQELLPPALYILEGDGFLKTSLNKLYSLQIEKNQNLFNATEQNLAINRVEQEIDLLKNNLLVYLENTRVAIHNKIQNLEGQIGDYENLIRGVPKAQRDILNIERKLQVNEKMYLFLLEKRANTVIARAGILPKTKVIESARSVGVIRPDKTKVSYTFIGVGLTIAIIIILIKEVFFHRITTVRELTEITDIPIAGGIPFIKDQESLSVETLKSRSLLAESIRNIRTNLQYLIPDQEGKTLLITSLNPAEGKTFTSAHLAAMLAKAGKKTLLIDLDLHKPRMHKKLSLGNEQGVSTIVIGKNEIKDCVQQTAIENLEVITAGPVPPNPSELLMNSKTLDIIKECQQHYDFVIIDTPPVGLITDGLVLLKSVDLGLFVFNTKFATRESVKYLEEIVGKFDLKHKALVLNGFKFTKWKRYYGNYAYKYAYGYGYGFDYGKNEGN